MVSKVDPPTDKTLVITGLLSSVTAVPVVRASACATVVVVKVNWSADPVADVPLAPVTVTSTTPFAWAGETAVI